LSGVKILLFFSHKRQYKRHGFVIVVPHNLESISLGNEPSKCLLHFACSKHCLCRFGQHCPHPHFECILPRVFYILLIHVVSKALKNKSSFGQTNMMFNKHCPAHLNKLWLHTCGLSYWSYWSQVLINVFWNSSTVVKARWLATLNGMLAS